MERFIEIFWILEVINLVKKTENIVLLLAMKQEE